MQPRHQYLTYNYSKANWEDICSYILHHNFDQYYLQTDVEVLWVHLKQVLVDAIEAHVPKFF